MPEQKKYPYFQICTCSGKSTTLIGASVSLQLLQEGKGDLVCYVDINVKHESLQPSVPPAPPVGMVSDYGRDLTVYLHDTPVSETAADVQTMISNVRQLDQKAISVKQAKTDWDGNAYVSFVLPDKTKTYYVSILAHGTSFTCDCALSDIKISPTTAGGYTITQTRLVQAPSKEPNWWDKLEEPVKIIAGLTGAGILLYFVLSATKK